jgi:hypothetical protein
MELAPSILSA